jgi:short-subunit dehydrogenase
MLAFDGKLVFVTGASSGIGRALALQFAGEGATVAVAARREDRLRALEVEVRAIGGKVFVIPCDVSRDGELQRAVAGIHAALGTIDVVVANAGFGVHGEVEDLLLDDYRRQLETNVFGVLRTIHSTLDDLKEKKGTLVLLGSVAGYVASPGSSAYAMSKYAVRALAEALNPELKPYGVKVVLISPGYVDSEIRLLDNQGRLRADGKDQVPRWLRMRVEVAARKIVAAVAKGKRELVLTSTGKTIVFLAHHFPGLLRKVVTFGMVRRLRRPKAGT